MSFVLITFLLTVVNVNAQKYDPGAGKTNLLIGQTWQQEFIDYVNAYKAPAGSSHYGEIYSGEVNQGDDAFGNNFLTYMNNNYPGAYALVAISIKDNPGAGGYGDTYSALRDIVAGRWDAEIDKFARTFADHSDLKFYVRLGYEVSLYMFASGGDTQTYKDAYNRMAQRIRAIASNVDFVYHPVRGFNDVVDLYPGDQYVDWVAFSIFNHDVCLSSPSGSNCSGQQIDGNLAQGFDWAKNTKGKPVMIAESAVQRYASESASGFMDYLDRVKDVIETYDIGVWAYIDSDWNAHNWTGDWGDSRVEINQTVLNHWNSIVSTSRYIHYNDGPPPPPSCTDGIQNGDETGVDCGGSCPDDCPPAHCSDGVISGDEEGVDCGGSCPDKCQNTSLCGEFGVSYVDDNTIRVYHKDNGWTGSWNYLCLSDYCLPGGKADGYYYKDFDATLGNTYTIQFKVQDNATGQYLSPVETVTFTTDQCSFVGGTKSSKLTQAGLNTEDVSNEAVIYIDATNNILNLVGVDEGTRVSVFNISGIKVIDKKVTNTLDISGLKKGIYILTTENNVRYRFVKE